MRGLSGAGVRLRRRAVPHDVTETAAPAAPPRGAVADEVPDLAARVTGLPGGPVGVPRPRGGVLGPLGPASGTDGPAAAGDRSAREPIRTPSGTAGPAHLRRGVVGIRGLALAASEARRLGREHHAAPLGAVPVPGAEVSVGGGRGRGGRQGRSARGAPRGRSPVRRDDSSARRGGTGW